MHDVELYDLFIVWGLWLVLHMIGVYMAPLFFMNYICVIACFGLRNNSEITLRKANNKDDHEEMEKWIITLESSNA